MGVIDYERVAEVVREAIFAHYIPNSCIAAARVTTRALRHFGIHSEAMACELEAYSPAWIAMAEHAAEVGRQLTAEEVKPFQKAGAWRVQLKFGKAEDGVVDNRRPHMVAGYHGHVVTLVEGRTRIVDPTLAQVDRPEKHLVVTPPFTCEIDYEQARTGRHVEVRNGSALLYKLLPGRRDFVKAPDWRTPGAERTRTMGIVLARVITQLQEVVNANV